MKSELRFQGVAVSPGIVQGTAYVYRPDEDLPPRTSIREDQVDAEIERFQNALGLTRRQIIELHDRVRASLGASDAEIFEAHLMVVEDGVLIEEVQKTLRRELCNAEHAFHTVAHRYAKSLAALEDPYFRERASDIHDISRRIVRNLLGRPTGGLSELKSAHVVIAHNLTPSDTAQIDRDIVIGFCTEAGGKTSHTAIMARSLNIPAIVGLHEILATVESGDAVLVDGYSGLLIVHPSAQTLAEYGALQESKAAVEMRLTELRETASTTQDGRHIILSANIEQPEDIEQAKASGAQGVGLLRTEFLYLGREDLPSEDEQAAAYTAVAAASKPHALIIRTLDLGGDKLHATLHATAEENPFLGWRAIRVCLERKDIFKTQLRAILRASVHGSIKLMFPMISGMAELRQAKAILDECRAELDKEGVPFEREMEVGMMIEIPSAAMIADLFAKEVDFFSLGTNDLVQYTIAADRGNEHIAHLYEPTHPAVLRLIRKTVEAANAAGIWVGVCGEMGGDIVLTPLLIGLGVDELSCGSAVLPRVKRAVRSLDATACRQLASDALDCADGAEILARCEAVARSHYGDLL
jgi:phosphoenolpyruvate-protein phosphotransferase (PTS system enzyme I)